MPAFVLSPDTHRPAGNPYACLARGRSTKIAFACMKYGYLAQGHISEAICDEAVAVIACLPPGSSDSDGRVMSQRPVLSMTEKRMPANRGHPGARWEDPVELPAR